MSKFFGSGGETPKAFHERLFKALENGEDDDFFGITDGMEYIQDYLESSYYLSINPLRELRRILPQYEWRFIRCKDMSEAKRAVTESDFVWLVTAAWMNPQNESESFDIVTARARVQTAERRKYCFGGKKNASADTTRVLQWIEQCGGDPVYFVISNR